MIDGPAILAVFGGVLPVCPSDRRIGPPTFVRLKKWENPPPFANLIDIDFPVVPASGKKTHARHGGDANVGIAVLLQKMPKRRDITAYRVEKRGIAYHRVC